MEKYNIELKNCFDLMMAGNCTLTLQNESNQKRFTYKIKKFKKNEKIYFVSVLRGQNNNNDYTYMGRILVRNFEQKEIDFSITQASKITTDALSYKGFKYLMDCILIHNKISESMKVYHSGNCARCGRKLTTPESILRGIGPECANKI
jgi:hypothetical protein